MSRFYKYRRALRVLRATCPVGRPVRVRLRRGPNPLDGGGRGLFGYCEESRDGRSLNITIRLRYGRRPVTPEELEDIAVHEWAHVMSWDSPLHHGPAWGRAYARAYRAVTEGR